MENDFGYCPKCGLKFFLKEKICLDCDLRYAPLTFEQDGKIYKSYWENLDFDYTNFKFIFPEIYKNDEE